MDDVLARLRQLQAADLPVHGGRTLAYVYDSGLPDVDRIGREAVAAYAGSNGLDPTSFPSLLAMENDLVGFACDLLDAPDSAVGSVTSGGTESVLLAVQGARDASPSVANPSMVVPSTVHAAFHKAAHYFGVDGAGRAGRPRLPRRRRGDGRGHRRLDGAGRRLRAVVRARRRRPDPGARRAGRVARDPLPRRRVHRRVGAAVRRAARAAGAAVDVRRRRASPRSRSTLHKYAYAPKGTSLLLHRTPELRRPQFFASADWPGYTMLNTTMQSTKSGGPLAGAWAVVQHLGVAGYLALGCLACSRPSTGSSRVCPSGLSVVVPPDSTLVALTCDDVLRRVHRVRRDDGARLVRAAADVVRRRAADHPPVGLGRDPVVRRRAARRLASSVAAARAAGPVVGGPGGRRVHRGARPGRPHRRGLRRPARRLRPDGRPAAGLALPARMAPVNAMLDVASPALREALLIAFLDRLSRPVRG